MKKLAWLGLSAVLLCGCQGGEPAPATNGSAEPVAHAKVVSVSVPGTKTATDIVMVVKPDKPVKVGSSPEDAMAAYKDNKVFGFGSDKLPQGFGDSYGCQTWECARFGFGVITYEDKIVAAVYQQDKFTQDRVDDIVKAHTDRMSDIKPIWIQGKHVNYWFWENGGQRAMICAFDSVRNAIQLTVAMGDDVVMNALGMSPELAQRDSIVVDTMMTRAGMVAKPAAGQRG